MNSDYFTAEEVTHKNKGSLFKSVTESIFLKNIAKQIVFVFLGFISSRGTIFGGFAPFSTAIIASAPLNSVISVTVGIAIGCFFPYSLSENIRYIACTFAIIAIRWTLNDLTAIKSKSVFSPLVAFLPLFATGVAMFFIKQNDFHILIMYTIEAIISATIAYFFKKSFDIFNSTRGINMLSQQDSASLIISFGVSLVALSNLEINNISVGHIIAICTIMICAYSGSVAGGTVSGVATGLIFSLQSSTLGYISGAYAIGGMFAGIFSPAGKFATVTAFMLSNGIVAIQTGNSQTLIKILIETTISSLLFLLIPKKWLSNVKWLFHDSNSVEDFEAIKNNTSMKLDFFANSISSVSETIDRVAEKLRKIDVCDPEKIHRTLRSNVCKHCGIKTLCWGKEYDKTMDTINYVTEKIHQKGSLKTNDFPYYLNERCSSVQRIADTMNGNYKDYTSKVEANRRISEIRNVVYEQFMVMDKMLKSLSSEIKNLQKLDICTSKKIENLLLENNIYVRNAICKIDEQNHMFIEIEIEDENNIKTIEDKLFYDIEKICGCKFDKPLLFRINNISKIQINEKTPYIATYSVRQHSHQYKKLCGDSYECFEDGRGNSIFIISDGMGTGGRAAIDGAMTTETMSKLIKADFDLSCALKIVNSSILIKSQEESLATLDILYLNRFTGECISLKAGASSTFVRQDNRCIRVEAPSLPVGILNDVEFSKTNIQLSDQDRIIMVSDGATAFGDEWIIEELLNWDEESEKEISDKIINQARNRRNDNHDDDITVISIKLLEAKANSKKI